MDWKPTAPILAPEFQAAIDEQIQAGILNVLQRTPSAPPPLKPSTVRQAPHQGLGTETSHQHRHSHLIPLLLLPHRTLQALPLHRQFKISSRRLHHSPAWCTFTNRPQLGRRRCRPLRRVRHRGTMSRGIGSWMK